MGYYIFVFVATTLLGFLFDNLRRHSRNNSLLKTQGNWFLFFILLIYVVFVGCRGYNVGSDTPMYVNRLLEAKSFNYIEFLGSHGFIEPLFYSIVWFFSRATQSASFFFIVCSLFYFVTFLKFSLRYCENLGWSIWLINSLGFTTLAISNVRQSLAIAICLIAYMYLEKSKWKAWLFWILAVCTHLSSIIFIPMLFVKAISKRNIVLFFIVLLGIVSFAGSELMGNMALSYALSTGKEVYETADEEGVGGLGMIAFLALILIMGVSSYFPKKKEYPSNYYYEFIAIGLALLVFIVSRFNQGTMRLFWYYLAFSAIYIPNVLSVKKQSQKQFWQLLLFFITIYYLTTRIMASPYDDTRMFLPYHFFWE